MRITAVTHDLRLQRRSHPCPVFDGGRSSPDAKVLLLRGANKLFDVTGRLAARFPHDHRAGDPVAVDTFFVGHLKGVDKVYLQIAVDCC